MGLKGTMTASPNPESARLEVSEDRRAWRTWGPYLSERQWGTVREDYSATGDAWSYLPHDHARSRAYRWGEDGLAGFSDDRQLICLSLALWNGQDPCLKERLFGLTNAEGNHGEDVKELYYYVDGVPSHAYMKMVYKYPQAAYPYEQLLAANRERGLDQPEFELIDTGIFDEDRYFDVIVEYAKADAGDVMLKITSHNRGPAAATLHILPQIWFRNTWSWCEGTDKPNLMANAEDIIAVRHEAFAPLEWHCDADAPLLFCENETNENRLYGKERAGWFKDAFHDAVVEGRVDAVNPARTGTKAAAHVIVEIPSGGSHEVRVRLRPTGAVTAAFDDFDAVLTARREEADAFYAELQRDIADEDARRVQRQALAGMLWSKQFYGYDVLRWLEGDPAQPPPPPERLGARNRGWRHLALGNVDRFSGGDIMAMPDTWEYPWFAAWDLAFHTVTLALVDPDFAKGQLLLLTEARALHPSGQMAAYEWNFDDVNPPVHAWAALRVFAMDRAARGTPDFDFLKRVFNKLMLNFTWWVNREDLEGNNLFEGGFLGLDNIGVFDLRKPLPGGGRIDQSDGTAWAAMFALDMMGIAFELASQDCTYEDLATKFFEHFIYIAEALHGPRGSSADGLWDDEDQFYYNVLRQPDRPATTLRVRSIVGLLPLFVAEVIDFDPGKAFPRFAERMRWFTEHRPDLSAFVSVWTSPNPSGMRLLALLRTHRLRAILSRMLDPEEFLSDHGIRSVSKYHEQHPYVFEADGEAFTLQYEPGEGRTRIYGGNSNWRGPVWMPINFLIVESLRKLHRFYGAGFTVPFPTGSDRQCTLTEIADELSARLTTLFVRDDNGRRTYLADQPKQQDDPNFRDLLQFHEYFDGDTGRGLGAAHQTGWTALVALLISQNPEKDTP
jgi:hypothetical protein